MLPFSEELPNTTLSVPFRKTDCGLKTQFAEMKFEHTSPDENLCEPGKHSTCLKGIHQATYPSVSSSFQQRINEHLLSRHCSRYCEFNRLQDVCNCFLHGAHDIYIVVGVLLWGHALSGSGVVGCYSYSKGQRCGLILERATKGTGDEAGRRKKGWRGVECLQMGCLWGSPSVFASSTEGFNLSALKPSC